MPIIVPDNLPAIGILKNENIFIMEGFRALHQDIRPLKIAFCNLMPLKIVTETDFIRVLSNTPLQIEIDFFYMDKHDSKNTAKSHLNIFYKTFDKIKNNRYDGLIITGAPVEHLDFEEVDYWDDLKEVMAWSITNITSTLHICWGAQAGLYYHYGIPKYPLEKKLSGVFEHQVMDNKLPLFRGFDDFFFAPHSRYTTNKKSDILQHSGLNLAAWSEKAGVHVVMAKNNRQIFVTGHFEYNPETLLNEYTRDTGKGLKIDVPENYFPDNNPQLKPITKWRATANLFFVNWLNYYVYQETPYEW
ncbi:MAG TPA: homoserine O-succinyltransferase [Bacteroidales bacterium]|nr:homoserine O-succinyltransferase [Bacteroidales bacterium]